VFVTQSSPQSLKSTRKSTITPCWRYPLNISTIALDFCSFRIEWLTRACTHTYTDEAHLLSTIVLSCSCLIPNNVNHCGCSLSYVRHVSPTLCHMCELCSRVLPTASEAQMDSRWVMGLTKSLSLSLSLSRLHCWWCHRPSPAHCVAPGQSTAALFNTLN